MKTGEREIALLFHRFAELQLPAPRGRALDFGCGVGRLTQALARRMESVVGADISPVMIDLAQRLNQYPDRAATSALGHRPRDAAGAILSMHLLQHCPPARASRSCGQLPARVLPLARAGWSVGVPTAVSPRFAWSRPRSSRCLTLRTAPRLSWPPAPRPGRSIRGFPLTLMVRNESARIWQQPHVGPLAVGNHWLDATGELMLLQDDGRSPLLQVVPPGLEWPVLLTMRAPGEPGRYVVRNRSRARRHQLVRAQRFADAEVRDRRDAQYRHRRRASQQR